MMSLGWRRKLYTWIFGQEELEPPMPKSCKLEFTERYTDQAPYTRGHFFRTDSLTLHCLESERDTYEAAYALGGLPAVRALVAEQVKGWK